MERFLPVRWSDEDGTQTELLPRDDRGFLAVRWSAEDSMGEYGVLKRWLFINGRGPQL